MSTPCEWCAQTSAQIDSLEYQVDQLQRELRELKAHSARLDELKWLQGYTAGRKRRNEC